MVGFHLFNPLLFVFTKVAHHIIGPLYNRFGVPGVLALPWITLASEKVAYDTFLAARGYDLQEERRKKGGQNPHGEFPSGGAGLPSLSLLPVANEQQRLIISIFGDEPRKLPTDAASPA
jgi:hypothetical protein